MNFRKRAAELLEQDHFNDRPSRILNLLLISLISLNILAIFLESVDSIYAEYSRNFWIFEVFSVAVFTVEYIVRVWSSVDLVEAGFEHPVMGRIRYMLRPISIVDLLAILPFYLSLLVSFDLRFLRVLRLLRLFKLTRYSPALGALLDVIQSEAEALLAAVVVLLTMLVISAAGIYLLESDLQPDTFGDIPSATWWAMVTLTTVGYGDVVPITVGGKIFGGVIGLIGIGMIALPAAIMASGFAENVRERRMKYNQYVIELMSDGILDETDRSRLEDLRRELGLRKGDALHLLQEMLHQASDKAPAQCPQCGASLKTDSHHAVTK
ncbi:MAG: potassium channel family protein [Gammaproteobacteria bacterium]|nr:potassium channel family protein [Gammaproteobacteria bacterium]